MATELRREAPSTVLVTVQGPEQRIELQLPCDRPTRELTVLLVDVCAPGQGDEEARWELGYLGGLAFDSAKTLAQVGVLDGSVLHLRNAIAAPLGFEQDDAPELAPPALPMSSAPPRPVDELLPQERTQRALPLRVPLADRVQGAVRAALRASPPAPPALLMGQPAPGQIVSPASVSAPSSRMVDRARASWRSTDHIHRLDAAIVAPALRRCATIAVMSPKGGVGKTTIAALLGSLLSLLRRDRVIAIDTNPDFGSLGRQLAPNHTVFIDDLHEVLDEPELTATALDNHLSRAAHGLMVLPAPTDPARVSRLDAPAYTKVVRRLQQMVGVIVLDSGSGLHEPAARAAMATADQVVLVSDMEVSTASLVAEAAAVLAQEGLPTWLVLNKSGVATELDRRALGSIIPHARGMIEVRHELEAARRVAAGRFSWDEAPPSWRRSVRELALTLVADWPQQGISF